MNSPLRTGWSYPERMGTPYRSSGMTASEHETPVGRRIVLGMLGLGAAGVLVGRRVPGLAPAGHRADRRRSDPTGLTQLLPVAGGFRLYTITDSFPSTTSRPGASR